MEIVSGIIFVIVAIIFFVKRKNSHKSIKPASIESIHTPRPSISRIEFEDTQGKRYTLFGGSDSLSEVSLMPIDFEFKIKVLLGEFIFPKDNTIDNLEISSNTLNGSFRIEKSYNRTFLYLDLTKVSPPINRSNELSTSVFIKFKKNGTLYNSDTEGNKIFFLTVNPSSLKGLMVFARLEEGDFIPCVNDKNTYLYSHNPLRAVSCQIAIVNYKEEEQKDAYIFDTLTPMDVDEVLPLNLPIRLKPLDSQVKTEGSQKGIIDFQERDRSQGDYVLFEVDMDLSSYNRINVIKFPLSFNYGLEKVEKFLSNIYIQEKGISTWVTIDIGTSAISGMANNDIIDLQQGLKYLKRERYLDLDFGERRPFLASTSILKSNSLVFSDHYDNELVQISPSMNDILNDTPHMLPPLKMLLGVKELQNERGTYNINYQKKEGGEVINVTELQNWIEIEDLLTSFFLSLFRDFIQQDSNIASRISLAKLNRIIFTIPNVFSVNERTLIRKILKGYFNYLEDIIFLSESDASACYYLKNWEKLNKNNNFGRTDDQILQLRPKSGEGVEYVLIYDMGAGTLDITYLKITSKLNDIYVEILGNFSSIAAGNYADYVISEAFINHYNDSYDEVFDNDRTEEIYQRNRFKIKNFIKRELKPLLNLNQETLGIKNQEHFELQLGDNDIIQVSLPLKRTNPIIESVENFTRLNSSDVLGHFFALHGNATDNQVDTMIFTGRATQLNGLKEELKRSIYDFTSSRDIVFMDLEEQELKLAPAIGAMFFAETYLNTPLYEGSKNINARYGFVTKNDRGYWHFSEILNPSTTPISNFCNKKEGVRVFEYDINDVINITYTDGLIYFVKSYSKFTHEDFTKDGYVSVIYQFNKDAPLVLRDENGIEIYNPSSLPVSIVVDANNDMSVSVGKRILSSEDRPSEGFTLNDTFTKSMWPHLI